MNPIAKRQNVYSKFPRTYITIFLTYITILRAKQQIRVQATSDSLRHHFSLTQFKASASTVSLSLPSTALLFACYSAPRLGFLILFAFWDFFL